jgi:hypothetical protein
MTRSSGGRPGLTFGLAGVAALASLFGCQAKSPIRESFTVAITAMTEDGEPIRGARYNASLFPGGAIPALAPTGPDGVSSTTILALAGTKLEVEASCPEGYSTPEPLIRLTLQHMQAVGPERVILPLAVSVRCVRAERLATVVVRADGQGGLPVILDGKVVGKTNFAGIAQVVLQMPSNSTFTVGLDTRSKPRLRPQQPENQFLLGDADDVFVFDQTFLERKLKKKKAQPGGIIKSCGTGA